MGDEEDDSSGSVVVLLERSPGAWVRLACHRWVACCPSLDWGQRPHSGKKKKNNDKVWHQKLHFTSATSSNRTISNKTEGYDRAQRILHSLNFRDSLMATQLFSHTDKSFVQSHKTFFCHNAVVWGETLNLQGAFSRSGE